MMDEASLPPAPSDSGVQILCGLFSSAEEVSEELRAGRLDAATMPLGIAAELYRRTDGAVACAAVTGSCNFYLMSADSSVRLLSDLLGRKVSIAGDGPAQALFRWLLLQNSIPVEAGEGGIQIVRAKTVSEAAVGLLSGRISCAVLPEPAASAVMTASRTAARAIDLQDEYAAVAGAEHTLPLSVLVVRAVVAAERPEDVRLMLSAAQRSVEAAVRNPALAASLVERLDLGISASVAAYCVPFAGFSFELAPHARERIERALGIFTDSAGSVHPLPGDGFYLQLPDARQEGGGPSIEPPDDGAGD
ncbi:MAG: ABC transporter substrate-binding protein [Treponemataceae bacterium]|nr:ABC transporter substrate-binding protein [Treponemataceae bacterium]